MKKIVSLLLALLMVGAVLVSCNPPATPDDTTPSDSTPSDTPEETPGATEEILPPIIPEDEVSLELIKGYVAKAKIVYPQGDLAMLSVATKLRMSFIQNTTVQFDLIDDEAAKYDENTVEIVLGDTNRPETATLKKYLGYNDYGVAVVGKKLVIAAHHAGNVEEALTVAENIMFKNLVEKNNLSVSSNSNYVTSKYYQYAKNRKLLGNSYGVYNIVLPEDCKYYEYLFAIKLQHFVGNKTGRILDIVYDSEPATDYEILIGKTNRTQGAVGTNKYLVNVVGNKVEMLSDTFYGYDYLYAYCEKYMMNELNKATADEGAVSDTSYVDLLKADGSESFLQKTGDVRVIFNNVFGFNLESLTTPNHSCMPEIRNPMITEFYSEFAPDVLCLEEITSVMRETSPISELIKEYGYEEVETPTFAAYKKCTTPIFYNTKTIKCVASGANNFHTSLYPNTVNIPIQSDKFMTWAVFEVIATKKQFAVINVHMDSFDTHGTGSGETKAIAEIQLMVQTAKQITQQYNCPLLMGGDFNTTIEGTSHKILTNASVGYTDIQTIAKKTDSNKGYFHSVKNMVYNYCLAGGFYTGEKETNPNYSESVDHIYASPLATEKITFNTFDILSDATVSSFADHCGMVLDFTFN